MHINEFVAHADKFKVGMQIAAMFLERLVFNGIQQTTELLWCRMRGFFSCICLRATARTWR